MFELIYPVDPAPILPSLTANSPRDGRLDGEVFPIVEESGLVVGRASRSYCHGGSRLLHPVVHLHIIDREERIYLQKRSMKKDIQPGKWDTAVGGHVGYGESLVEALLRESMEELHLTRFNPVYIGTYPYDSDRERELVNIFAAVGSFDISPDLDEVTDGRFWTIAEIGAAMGKNVLTPNFEMEFGRIRNKLLALL